MYELLLRIAPHAMEWTLILAPVTLYILYLAMWVNVRKTPKLVTGRRNACHLLLAGSGILLLGPPTWILAFLHPYGAKVYWAGYTLYAAAIAMLAWRFISRQARRYQLFHVSPFALRDALESVLAALNQPYLAQSRQVTWTARPLILEVDIYPFWRSAQLRFSGTDAALESQFIERLQEELRSMDHASMVVHYVLTIWGGLFLLFHVLSVVLFIWYLQAIP